MARPRRFWTALDSLIWDGEMFGREAQPQTFIWYPTGPFKIVLPQNCDISEFYVVQERRRSKLQIGRSGR